MDAERVVAGVGVDDVVAISRLPKKVVVAGTAMQHVVAGLALDAVVARAAGDRVVPGSAGEQALRERAIGIVERDGVIAIAAADPDPVGVADRGRAALDRDCAAVDENRSGGIWRRLIPTARPTPLRASTR